MSALRPPLDRALVECRMEELHATARQVGARREMLGRRSCAGGHRHARGVRRRVAIGLISLGLHLLVATP